MGQDDQQLRFSFVVINYNSFDYTRNCLKSIEQFCRQHPYEIIVIDNASADDSASKLASQFTDVIFIKNKENYGFARACNQGIDRASGEYIIFLNNDFEFTTDIFDRIIDKFQRYENLGLLGFQLLNPDGSPQRTGFVFPTLFRRILQLTLVPLMRKRTSVLKPQAEKQDQVIDYIKGALMIIPSRLLHQLQLRFDEYYFMYHEELDLAYQLRRHGKICLLDSTPAGIHYGMNFEDIDNERVFLLRQKNLLYFYQKNFGRIRLLLLVLINIVAFSFKWLFSLGNSYRRKVCRKVIQLSLEFL